MNAQKQTATIQFSETDGSGVFMREIESNYYKFISLLRQNGLRTMAYQEAPVLIDKNPELKEQLKGKRLYIDGAAFAFSKLWGSALSALSGYCTFNEEGQLTPGRGDIEKTIYVWKNKTVHGWKGNQPVLLSVYTDVTSRINWCRYLLDTNISPDEVVSAVVGIKDDRKTETAKPYIDALRMV